MSHSRRRHYEVAGLDGSLQEEGEEEANGRPSPSAARLPSPLQRQDSIENGALPLTSDIELQARPRRLQSDPGSYSFRQQVREDEIIVLEDVNVDVHIPVRLTSIDFPGADDGHEGEVAKAIRKGFSKLGLQHNPADAFSLLSSDALSLPVHLSWQAQVGTAVEQLGDEFWRKVASKSQELSIGETESIFEVFTDSLVEKCGGEDHALLWVLRKDYRQFCMEVFVIRLLERGASVTSAGPDLNTPLHLAARHGYCNVARKLLEKGAPVMAKNNKGQVPLELAIEQEHSDFAKLMIKSSEPPRVRQLFQGAGKIPSRLSLHWLLEHPAMQSTVMAVLDTLMEPLQGQSDTFLIHYAILDSDTAGRAPADLCFDKAAKSCLHKIAKSNNKEVVYHDVVRLLLRRKWKKFARYVLCVQFIIYLLLMLFLTLALVLAAREPDPRQYRKPVDIFRGFCEVISLLAILFNGISELNQLRIHKAHYFIDKHNYLDVPAVICSLLIIPFRATGLSVQWLFSSLSYLFNGLRAFKYAAVFRSTGAYVQILLQILLQDMVQFGSIFCVFLVSFSGAFYLALRGEITAVNGTAFANGSSDIMTSLDIYPYETAEFYNVLFTGVRVMLEGATIVDEYFGPAGFGWLGVIVYLLFLFLVIVVLLNLLIAQMSDTYASVQQDAQRSLAINRAWIIARVEHNSLLGLDYRKQFYRSCAVVKHPQEVLEQWEVPPIREVNRKLDRIERAVLKHEEAMDLLRTDILKQLSEQAEVLRRLLEEREQGRQSGPHNET